MYFAAPLWLLGLIPWAGVAAWMLRGRGDVVGVPFVELWRGPVGAVNRQRRTRPPSLAILLALIAIALAIVAAGGPHVRLGARREAITLIVDRGATMMPPARLDNVLADANRRLLAAFASDSPVKLIGVPGGAVTQTTLSDWMAAARQLPPVAIESDQRVDQTVEREARETAGLVVVISDRELKVPAANLIQVFPEPIHNDVGITTIAADAGAHPQVMVRLRNQSNRTHATLNIQTAGRAIAKEVSLPQDGGERAYFFDVPQLKDIVEASLESDDDFPLDDRAWLAPERVNSRIDLGADLPPEVGRIVEAYLKANPSGRNAPSIAVSAAALPNDRSGVVVPPDRHRLAQATRVELRASPITANLTMADLDDLSIGQPPSGGGWIIVASAGEQPLLALREAPARQVWVGLQSTHFAATPEFVVLWTNVLDYLNGGGERFASHPSGSLTADWKRLTGEPPASVGAGLWPGVYRRSDGALRAVNLTEPALRHSLPANAPQVTSTRIRRAGAVELTWAVVLGALVCLLAAAVVWPARKAAGAVASLPAARFNHV
jgi:hypothetical protein